MIAHHRLGGPVTIIVTGDGPPSPPGRRTRNADRLRRLYPAAAVLVGLGLAGGAFAVSRPVPAPAVPDPSAAVEEDLGGGANSALQLLGKNEEDIRARSIFTLDGSYVPFNSPLPPGDYHVYLSCAGQGRALTTVTTFATEPNGEPDLAGPDEVIRETRTICSDRQLINQIDVELVDDGFLRIEAAPDDKAAAGAGFAFMIATDPVPE
jgi:hypothetical protein